MELITLLLKIKPIRKSYPNGNIYTDYC